MPQNFNQTLQTQTPNIPTYQSDGQGGSVVTDALASLGSVVSDFLDQKNAEQEAAVVGAGADEYLGLINNQSQALADLRVDQAALGDQLANEQDEGKRKELRRQVAALDARAKQMRVDMGPQRVALFRRFVRENPHLVETANKIFGGLQNVTNNMLQDANSVETDTRTQAVNALQQEAIKNGVSVDYLTDTLMLDQRAKRSADELQLARDLGAVKFGHIQADVRDAGNLLFRDFQIKSRNLPREEAVKYAVSVFGTQLRSRLGESIKFYVDSTGGVLDPASHENLNQYVNAEISRAVQYANQFPDRKELRDLAVNDAKVAEAVDIVSGLNLGAMTPYFQRNPDAAFEQFVLPRVKALAAINQEYAALPAKGTQVKGRGGLAVNTPGGDVEAKRIELRRRAGAIGVELAAIDRASHLRMFPDNETGVNATYDAFQTDLAAGKFKADGYPPGALSILNTMAFGTPGAGDIPGMKDARTDMVLNTQTRAKELINSHSISTRERILSGEMYRYLASPEGAADRETALTFVSNEAQDYAANITGSENGVVSVTYPGSGATYKFRVNEDVLTNLTTGGNLVTLISGSGVGPKDIGSSSSANGIDWADRINSAYRTKLTFADKLNGPATVREEFRALLGLTQPKEDVKANGVTK